MVLGSRLAEPGVALAGGMPRYKYAANRVLAMIENRCRARLSAST
jgi:hypothetical protein